MIKLKPPSVKDTELYIDFLNEAYKESMYVNKKSKEEIQALLNEFSQDRTSISYLAYDGNKIVGQLFTVAKQKTIHIKIISVLEFYHGKGVSKLLINELERQAKYKGFIFIELIVKKNNDRAISFYKKMMFHKVKNYNANNELWQKKIDVSTESFTPCPIYLEW